MTPLQRIRENPDEVRATLEARGFKAPLDRIIELDAQVRKLLSESETLKAERNRASKGGPPSDAVKARMRELGDRIKTIDAELGTLQAERDAALLWIPNVIDPKVPQGSGSVLPLGFGRSCGPRQAAYTQANGNGQSTPTFAAASVMWTLMRTLLCMISHSAE